MINFTFNDESSPTKFDQFLWTPYKIITVLLFLIVVFLAIKLLQPSLEPFLGKVDSKPVDDSSSKPDKVVTALWFELDKNNNLLYYTKIPDKSKMTDIYRKNFRIDNAPDNLTNSTDYSELFPTLSPNLDRLAFFAISQNGDRSLRIIKLNTTDSPQEITSNSGVSRLGDDCNISFTTPPSWSPDGSMIAFLAKCKNWKDDTIELFIAPTDGSGVKELRREKSKNNIESFCWTMNDKIIYIEKRENESGAIYEGFINNTGIPSKLAEVN